MTTWRSTLLSWRPGQPVIEEVGLDHTFDPRIGDHMRGTMGDWHVYRRFAPDKKKPFTTIEAWVRVPFVEQLSDQLKTIALIQGINL